MKLVNPRPTDPPLATWEQLQAQSRVLNDVEKCYAMDVLDACTAHAEKTIGSSLLERDITATYFHQDAIDIGNGTYAAGSRRLFLPYGPVQSVSSVTDATGKTLTRWSLECEGCTDLLRITQFWAAPLTVVYVAGYGPDVCDVPSDIRMGLRTHVATLFEQRASTDEKVVFSVPHSMEAFYARHRRTPLVG